MYGLALFGLLYIAPVDAFAVWLVRQSPASRDPQGFMICSTSLRLETA
jgi:hypothetical protein